jgi:hypothetical protein
MADSDLNLLTALDALLAEGSVVGAARRLRLSSSAMSRTLARLREATGDPLLASASDLALRVMVAKSLGQTGVFSMSALMMFMAFSSRPR